MGFEKCRSKQCKFNPDSKYSVRLIDKNSFAMLNEDHFGVESEESLKLILQALKKGLERNKIVKNFEVPFKIDNYSSFMSFLI